LAFRSSIARVALALAALATPLASGAFAATLQVNGPAGAEVVLRGEVLGVLPLSEPIELPHGQVHVIEIRKPGYVTHEEQVLLQMPETEQVVDVELLKLGKRTAVIGSALLAGTGQFYQDRNTTAWIHLGLQLTAWGSAIYGELQFKDKRDEYELLDQQYKEALAPTEIAALSEDRDAKWNEMQDAKSWRNWSLGAVAVIAAWSAFDAWRGHDRFYATVQSPDESGDGTTTAQAGLRWNFGGAAR